MDDPIIGIMSPKAKEWFARAVVGMIWADGRIDQAEIDYLKSLLGFLKDKDLIHSVLGMIKQNKIPPLESIQLEQAQALAILKHLTSISIVDEDLDKSEVAFLKNIARLLNLPPEIPEKFISLGRKRLGGNRFHSNLLVGDDSLDVVCFGFSERECLFFSNRLVNPMARLTLRVYKDQKNRSESGLHAPFVAEAQWCRAVKSGIAKYVVKAVFKKQITSEEGARLIFSMPEEVETRKTFEPQYNSLLGYYLQCRVCGTNDIPFWQLRSRCLHTKNNIFGIPHYDRAVGGKDFCDYNLFQISVCPNCLFASNMMEYFQRQDQEIGSPKFDQKLFQSKWQPTLHKRKKLVAADDNWLYSLERTPEQAIVSYQLAMDTHQQLGLISDDLEQSNHQRKVVSFMLTQAEMLMDQGDKANARKLVQNAKTILEKAFPTLEKEAAIRAAHLIILINIYFKEYDNIGEYLNFLQKFDKLHGVASASKEAKILYHAMETAKDAWQSKDEYAFDKISSFHLKD
ncbi:DUF2225 domain-containing protein [bacterium]|nr:DUF2225 domain-containing protein [bacterium]